MTKLLIYISVLLIGPSAFAQKSGNARKIQFRVLLGQQFVTPSAFNDQIATIDSAKPEIKTPKYNSIDLLYVFDSKMLLGVRYDIMDFGGSTSGTTSTAKNTLRAERIDALIGWRFIQMQKAYFGLIAHASVSNTKFDYDIKSLASNGTTTQEKFTGKADQGYGVGIEGAYILQDRYPIGLELGYSAWSAKEFKNSADAVVQDGNGKNLEIDLSGLYVKAYVAFTF